MNRDAVITAVAIAVIAFCLYGFLFDGRNESAPTERITSVRVKTVVSANKLKTSSGDYVVLAGIRAPYRDEPRGEAAYDLVRELIEGETVRLRFDETVRDAKDRFVAYVFTEGQMVNEALVRQGLAYARLKKGQERYAEELLAAQKEARRARRGCWKSAPRGGDGELVGDRKHAVYHLPSCEDVPNIKPDDRTSFAGRRLAHAQGFAPCANCIR